MKQQQKKNLFFMQVHTWFHNFIILLAKSFNFFLAVTYMTWQMGLVTKVILPSSSEKRDLT